MKFKSAILFLFLIVISCSTVNLPDHLKNDISTSGALGDNCFQAVIKHTPDKNAHSLYERRLSAFLKAKEQLFSNSESQILDFYQKSKGLEGDAPENLKVFAKEISRKGVIEQEFYLPDDSVVLIYRIYEKDLKNKILSY